MAPPTRRERTSIFGLTLSIAVSKTSSGGASGLQSLPGLEARVQPFQQLDRKQDARLAATQTDFVAARVKSDRELAFDQTQIALVRTVELYGCLVVVEDEGSLAADLLVGQKRLPRVYQRRLARAQRSGARRRTPPSRTA